ncbi:MFS transporter [Actinoplanes palleronii]|uniref:MFS transporter n=1 Tax=Actinoplanes palleronii TaxID=113570 RepID=A0ABQ4B245_9ACTN|nr:MFS transporter [Actinoplanes palleronii]
MIAPLVRTVLPPRLGADFRWLVGSSWATNLGDGISAAAGPLLVASLTDDPFRISLAALLSWAPPLVCGLYAGVLSDRHDRRRILLLANAVRVLVLLALIGTLATGRLSVELALLGLGLLSTAEVFADNTTGTLAPMLVDRADLPLANARLSAGFITLNQLAGPPLGAALFAAGRAWPLAGEVLLLVAGTLLVSRVRLPAHSRPATAGVRRDVAEGVRWVVRHPAVRTLCLIVLIFNLAFGASWSVLVLYVSERLGLGSIGFGLVTTVMAAGGILATGAYGWLTARVSLGNLMRIGLFIETGTHAVLGFTASPWVALPTFFLFGVHEFVWRTTATTVRQRSVPTHLQGRVGAVSVICIYGGLVVGAAAGGVLASRYGVAAPFQVAFVCAAIFLAVLWPQMKHIAHDD